MHHDLNFAALAKIHTQVRFWVGNHQYAVARVERDLVGRRVDTTSTSNVLPYCSSRVVNPIRPRAMSIRLYDGKKTTTTTGS